MKAPRNIIYGADDTPPPGVVLVSAMQQVGLSSIFLLFPLLVFREIGLAADALNNALSLSMLALALGALLSGQRSSVVGSGFLCAPVFSTFYLGPSLLAARTGGLALVLGMTVFAGTVEALLYRMQTRLRAIFPPEISGFLVLMIGVNIGAIGARNVMGVAGPEAADVTELAVAVCTLATMIALTVWGKGLFRMFGVLLGMAVGYVASGLAGLLSMDGIRRVMAAPLLAAPSMMHLRWSWDLGLIVPFAIGALAACLKTVGCVTTCQKINDADWVRPDMRSIERGVLADALGTVGAGLLGAPGLNTSPTAIGVSHASGVTSRRIAFVIAGIFVLLAFLPKAAAVLAAMPRAVVGATLLFSASFVFMNGLEIVASRLLDARRTFVIGLSFMAGMAVDLNPAYFARVPESLQPLVSSSLVVGILCALALNVMFRIGTRRVAAMQVEPGRVDPVRIEMFVEERGAEWGARRDVIERARYCLVQSVEAVLSGCQVVGPLQIDARFDELRLDLRIAYAGLPMTLPELRPTIEEVIASVEGERALAGYFVRRLADRANVSHAGGRATLTCHFDH